MPASSPSLLQLPEELLINDILARLPLVSLQSCVATCRTLRSVVHSSLRLTYLQELEIAGLMDNSTMPYTVTPLPRRIQMLREHERRWRNLDAEWRQTLPLEMTLNPQTRIYGHGTRQSGFAFLEMVDPWYLVKDLRFFKLPNRIEEKENISEFLRIQFPGKEFISYTTAVEEYGLLACLTSHAEAGRSLVQLHFLDSSNGKYHPLAAQPTFNLFSLPPGVEIHGLSIQLSLCGTNLVVLDGSHLSIFDWTSGRRVLDFRPDDWQGGDCALLTESTILVAHTARNRLELYEFLPQTYDESGVPRPINPDTPPRLLRSFELPRIRSVNESSVFFEIKPTCLQRTRRRSALPFRIDPEFSLVILDIHSSTWIDDGRRDVQQTHTLIVHRATLLGSSDDPLPQSTPPSHILWEEWGPTKTRVLFRATNTEPYDTMGLGTRYAILNVTKGEVDVLDFGLHKAAGARPARPTTPEPNDSETMGMERLALTSQAEQQAIWKKGINGSSKGPDAEDVDSLDKPIGTKPMRWRIIGRDEPTIFRSTENYGVENDLVTSLPYILSRMSVSGWKSAFMDELRVCGMMEPTDPVTGETNSALEHLYFG